MKVYYYVSPTGSNPVQEFINSLLDVDQAKIRRIFQTVQEYGLNAIAPHIKKLSGTPIWEIRILGKTSIRILYVIPQQEMIVALHGFVKKTEKTPEREINVTLNRFENYKQRSKLLDK